MRTHLKNAVSLILGCLLCVLIAFPILIYLAVAGGMAALDGANSSYAESAWSIMFFVFALAAIVLAVAAIVQFYKHFKSQRNQ